MPASKISKSIPLSAEVSVTNPASSTPTTTPVPPVSPAMPSPFEVLERREPPVFQQPLRLSADNSTLNPIYCPPHIFVAWGLDGAGEGSVNHLRYEKGYEMATADMVTADLAEAKAKGLICLRHFTTDTTNRYVKHRELFLLVTKREWWENRQKLAMMESARQVDDAVNLVPGAHTTRESLVGGFDEEAEGFFQKKE